MKQFYVGFISTVRTAYIGPCPCVQGGSGDGSTRRGCMGAVISRDDATLSRLAASTSPSTGEGSVPRPAGRRGDHAARRRRPDAPRRRAEGGAAASVDEVLADVA